MSHSLFILTVNDVSYVMSCLKIKHVTVFRAKSNYIVTLKILPTVVSVITQRKKNPGFRINADFFIQVL